VLAAAGSFGLRRRRRPSLVVLAWRRHNVTILGRRAEANLLGSGSSRQVRFLGDR
jgi:hypothetical protein